LIAISHNCTGPIEAAPALEVKELVTPVTIEAPTEVEAKAKEQAAIDFVDPVS